MARCASCGAELSRGITWCERCFEPLVRSLPPAPPAPPTFLALPGEPRGESQRPEWGPLPEDLVLITCATPPPERLLVLPQTEPPSLFGSSGSPLNVARRLLLTAMLVAIGIGAYLFLQRSGSETASESRALVLAVAGAYTLLAGLLLTLVWRPARQSSS